MVHGVYPYIGAVLLEKNPHNLPSWLPGGRFMSYISVHLSQGMEVVGRGGNCQRTYLSTVSWWNHMYGAWFNIFAHLLENPLILIHTDNKTAASNINHQGVCVQLSFSEQPGSYYAWCTCSELNTTTPNSMENCFLSISPQSQTVKVCYYQLLTAVGLMFLFSSVILSWWS